jgi:hypothetical protein
MDMEDLQAIFTRLGQLTGPVALATLLRVVGPGPTRPGARFILDLAGPTGNSALERTLHALLASGRSELITVDSSLWPGAATVLLERMVPGHLPPWYHLCAQVLKRQGACVLATVATVTGDAGFAHAVGDRYVYDEHNHGLLPIDGTFSLELQRACIRTRASGGCGWERFELPGGVLEVALELLPAPIPAALP